MRNLSDKFIHRCWYKNADLTIKDFLELACIGNSIYLQGKTLKDEEATGTYELTENELNYYLARKQFYTQLKNKIRESNKTIYENEYFSKYIDIEQKELCKIPEYLEAHNKLLKSIRSA